MPSAPTASEHNAPPFQLSDVDRRLLTQTDDEFVCYDWDDLRKIIAKNDLGALKRRPSDLVRYIAWTRDIKANYGTVTNYICQKRLQWPIVSDLASLCQNQIPFADPSDYKILRNDWPYGVRPGITHLVVWLKNRIPVKPENGDMTDESRSLIDHFVHRTFVVRLENMFRDATARVQWFKNWTSLQSVRSLEHFHVLVRDIPEPIIVEWTGETAAIQG